MKEQRFFDDYTVLEIKRNGIYSYYLEKDGFGDLLFMYGTEEEAFPCEDVVSEYIDENAADFWGE